MKDAMKIALPFLILIALAVSVLASCSDLPPTRTGFDAAGMTWTSTQACLPSSHDPFDWLVTDCLDRATDCGSTPSPRYDCDISPALERIYSATFLLTEDDDHGPVVKIPSGDWWMSDTYRQGRATKIYGMGTRTTIHTTTTAFWCMHRSAAQLAGRGRGGPCDYEDFELKSEEFGTDDHVGIRLENRGFLDNIQILRFTHGVRISARLHPTEGLPTNASESRLYNTYVSLSRHAGYYIEGQDASAIDMQAVSGSNNCWEAGPWIEKYGHEEMDCAGIMDRSFLGIHLSGHVALSGPIDNKDLYPNYAIGLDANASSLCSYCYAEHSEQLNYVGRASASIGGAGAWRGPGLRCKGPFCNGMAFLNDTGENNVSTWIGHITGVPDHAMIYSRNTGRWSGLKYVESKQAWCPSVSNSNATLPWCFGAEHTSPLGIGGFEVLKPAPE